MKVHLSSDKPFDLAVDVLAVAVPTNFAKSEIFTQLDKLFAGELTKIAAREQWKARLDSSLVVHTLGKIKAPVLMLVGVGDKETLAEDRALVATAVRRATALHAKSLAILVNDIGKEAGAAGTRAEAVSIAARLAAYRFDTYRTKDKKEGLKAVEEVHLLGLGKGKAQDAGVALGKTIAEGISLARDLINEPASVVYPESFADQAVKMAKELGLHCTILSPSDLKKEKFGLLLAVGQGSDLRPRLVHLVYKPKKKTKRRVALIGKGVTFDSGGLILKPAGSMEDMKIDMSGGAAVLGAMSVVPSLDLDYEVHGFIGLVENMISSGCYRPGDVLTSRKGLTVEVNNTDAEGRLVLADVIDYAKEKVDPTEMIDLATLTGACMVALGPVTAGAFSNNDKLADSVLAASKAAGEDIWRMPMTESLKEQLRSDIADMKNTGERWGGAITAALFLKEFVEQTPWVHLDIAGPASTTKERGVWAKGGTGFGVATLVEWLRAS